MELEQQTSMLLKKWIMDRHSTRAKVKTGLWIEQDAGRIKKNEGEKKQLIAAVSIRSFLRVRVLSADLKRSHVNVTLSPVGKHGWLIGSYSQVILYSEKIEWFLIWKQPSEQPEAAANVGKG